MRAVVIHQFGDPTTLKVEEVPTPVPQGDDVLVAIRAASINPSDVKNVAGVMHGTTLPRIPGRDFAGVVTRGPADLLGREVFGTGGDIGFTRDGSHAEFLLLPRTAVVPKPPALSMEAAGGAGVTFVTAWSALVSAADIKAGDTVVIIGAGGGVGSAAVQIAAAHGARVIGVVRSDNDFAPVRQAGATDVINARTPGFLDSIQSLTNKRGAHIVFDTSGMMFAEAVEIAANQARIPVITAPPDGKTTFNLRTVYRKSLQIHGIDTRPLDAPACAQLLSQMSPHFQSGRFTLPPAHPMPLTDAIAAYQKASQHGPRISLQSTP